MKKKKTHPIHGVLLWALMLGACGETPVGIMDTENNIIMNSIRYLPEGNAEIAEKGDYLGQITDSNNTKIKVWSAVNDESGEYLWTDGYMDSTVYRKEYHSMSTEVKTLILGSKEMDYFRFGKEDGEKLVILPGLSLKSVMGAADAIVGAYALLAQKYDIYMFDRIRIFPEGYDVEAMADDTLAAMKQLDLNQVHLMGVSQGGMMAMMIALKSPETVKSLVLCSTASRIPEGSRSPAMVMAR